MIGNEIFLVTKHYTTIPKIYIHTHTQNAMKLMNSPIINLDHHITLYKPPTCSNSTTHQNIKHHQFH